MGEILYDDPETHSVLVERNVAAILGLLNSQNPQEIEMGWDNIRNHQAMAQSSGVSMATLARLLGADVIDELF